MKLRILVFLSMALTTYGGHEIHVSPDGDADGTGSKQQPHATLEQARDAIRAGRKSGAIEGDEEVTVLVEPGVYRLRSGLKLGKEDSGAVGSPVVYKASKRGTVHLHGGVTLSPESFKPVSDEAVLKRLDPSVRSKVVVCDVSAHAPKGGFPEFKRAYRGVPADPLLYVNGKPMTIARWPNLESDQGNWAGFTKVIDTGKPDPKSDDPAKRKAHAGSFVFEDARPARWDVDRGVWLFGYWTHDWSDEVIRIASYDGTKKVIELAAPHNYGIKAGTWGRKERRFYALNLLEELDAAGEWYLDRTENLLYFYPGEGFGSAQVILVTLTRPMVEIDGAEHVRFQELAFESGHSLGFSVKNAKDVHIEGCVVAGFAAGGVSLNGTDCSVRSCDVYHIGRAGINVRGGDRKTLTRGNNVVENNHVHHFGMFQRTYAAGLGLNGCGNVLRHNCVHDAPHAAVLYGGNEHLIAFNEVYRVVMETGDAGAFYTGRDWTTQGNVLRHNYVHHLGGGDARHVNTMGFYFDDCDCGDEVIGNVFFRAGRAIMIGGGREHPVVNNLVVECPIGLHIDSRGMTWKQWNEPNTSWWLEGKAEKLKYKQPPWSERYPRLARIMQDSPREPLYNPIRNNLFIDCTKQTCNFDARVMGLMGKFEITNNLAVFTASTNEAPLKKGIKGFTTLNGTPESPIDFGFKDQDAGNFNLRPGARLTEIAPHFKKIPFDRIGLYADEFRRELPERQVPGSRGSVMDSGAPID